MEVTLRFVEELAEALALAPELERHAAEITAEFRDGEAPRAIVRRLFERSFDAPETRLLAATVDGSERPVGVCVSAPLEDPLLGERVPIIVLLHVHPEFRHRGLARQMVAALERELRSRGIERLAARAAHNDDALISMGERWGFVRSWELMLKE